MSRDTVKRCARLEFATCFCRLCPHRSLCKKMSDKAHRHEFDSPFRNRVVGFLKAGGKMKEAQALFGISRSTAYSWCSKFNKFGATHGRMRSGRPRKLSDRAKRAVVLLAQKNRRLGLAALGNSVNPKVSSSTIRRVLSESGYHRRAARRKPYLRKDHIKLRQQWATKYKQWKYNHWQHIIWSDESYIHIGDNKGRVYITRRPNETYDDDCLIWSFNQSSVRVMVWGCFAQNYKGPLVMLDYPGGAGGGMNTERYIEQVLDPVVLGIYRDLKGSRRYMYYQQDGASFHKSKKTLRWFSKEGVQLFFHPPNSPDLNPIENLWSILKQRIRSRPHPPTSVDELKQAVQEAWDSITIDEINALVQSMPERVQQVLSAKGGHTSY